MLKNTLLACRQQHLLVQRAFSILFSNELLMIDDLIRSVNLSRCQQQQYSTIVVTQDESKVNTNVAQVVFFPGN